MIILFERINAWLNKYAFALLMLVLFIWALTQLF